jgi:4'-phosphopantetheinyl transferase
MPLFHPYHTNHWQLKSNCVDLWAFSLKTPGQAPFSLSHDEQAREKRLIFTKHQRRFRHAHNKMRFILSRYLNCSAEEIIFSKHAYGKPYITQTPLHFNLSHSGEVALLAISANLELGVDIENFRKRDYAGLAAHAFSPAEHNIITTVPPFLKAFTFYSLWSQKEAFIKACGQGLRYPTQSFTVQASIYQPYPVHDPIHQRYWWMQSFSHSPGCAAALCTASRTEAVYYYYLD